MLSCREAGEDWRRQAKSLYKRTDGTSLRLIPDYPKIESRRLRNGNHWQQDNLKQRGFWNERQGFANQTHSTRNVREECKI